MTEGRHSAGQLWSLPSSTWLSQHRTEMVEIQYAVSPQILSLNLSHFTSPNSSKKQEITAPSVLCPNPTPFPTHPKGDPNFTTKCPFLF